MSKNEPGNWSTEESQREEKRSRCTKALLADIQILKQLQAKNSRDLEREKTLVESFNAYLRDLMGAYSSNYEIRVQEVESSGIKTLSGDFKLKEAPEKIFYSGEETPFKTHFWGFQRGDNINVEPDFLKRVKRLPELGNQWYIKIGTTRAFFIPVEGIKQIKLVTLKKYTPKIRTSS